MQVSLIIVAGGSSSRYGNNNKLLEDLNGKPVFVHSIERLGVLANEIIMPVAAAWRTDFEQALHTYCPVVPVRLVPGGETRAESVWNALQQVSASAELVAVHDAARPLATAELFDQLIRAAKRSGAAIPGKHVVDTIKQTDASGMVIKTLNRAELMAVETPQVFNAAALIAAYRTLGNHLSQATDDAQIMELAGHAVFILPNPQPNRKLTFADDLTLLAEML